MSLPDLGSVGGGALVVALLKLVSILVNRKEGTEQRQQAAGDDTTQGRLWQRVTELEAKVDALSTELVESRRQTGEVLAENGRLVAQHAAEVAAERAANAELLARVAELESEVEDLRARLEGGA